jgi:hypothetical protein
MHQKMIDLFYPPKPPAVGPGTARVHRLEDKEPIAACRLALRAAEAVRADERKTRLAKDRPHLALANAVRTKQFAERRALMVEYVGRLPKERRVSTFELAIYFEVKPDTIRKDVLVLHAAGKIDGENVNGNGWRVWGVGK